MKTLYLDLGMGAAGDMLTAALFELLPEDEKPGFIDGLNGLGIPGVTVTAEKAVRCGITGTHFRVAVNGEEEDECMHEHEHEHEHHHRGHHHHTSLGDIVALAAKLNVSDKVREDVLAVYALIAEAESRAHGVPVSEIHFHEVGTADAVADITAVCLLMEKLAPERVVASPVHVGSGTVRCAHGVLPVPAPAAAYILRGIPSYGGTIMSELCTPTGAALVRHFVREFGPQPVMAVSAVGYGMGRKEFERANCVRAMLGSEAGSSETIFEFSCTVDDMTAEEIGFAFERLFEAGARDVFTTAVMMKKNRPGTLITVICAGDM
ncbi:MAG: nickel pincer cofactor biosynthesis protein LarC, partial [Clostridia bacterium]|nr:nickel pincer cofactor biosynthesis protein LarC [Clostridia bacterium]